MPFDKKSQDDLLAIAGDPSASEKQWMAACTVLDGKQPPTRSSNNGKKPHPLIGLPWSLAVSGAAGLGAFMFFGFLLSSWYEIVANLTANYGIFNSALAFALLSAGFATFSTVMAYQQHIWNGTRIWSVMKWTLIGLAAVLPCGMFLIFGSTPGTLDLLTFALWTSGFIGVSVLSTVLTNKSIKSLEGTVGAHRVMPHSRILFGTMGVVILGCLMLIPIMPMAGMTLTMTKCLWMPLVLIGSGYWIARRNGARNQHTAAVLGYSIWNPLFIANAVLLPALVINSIGAMVFGAYPTGFADYAIGLCSMLTLGVGPLVGATMASKAMQRSAELELHRMPNLPVATNPIASGGPASPLAEETV